MGSASGRGREFGLVGKSVGFTDLSLHEGEWRVQDEYGIANEESHGKKLEKAVLVGCLRIIIMGFLCNGVASVGRCCCYRAKRNRVNRIDESFLLYSQTPNEIQDVKERIWYYTIGIGISHKKNKLFFGKMDHTKNFLVCRKTSVWMMSPSVGASKRWTCDVCV